LAARDLVTIDVLASKLDFGCADALPYLVLDTASAFVTAFLAGLETVFGLGDGFGAAFLDVLASFSSSVSGKSNISS